MKQPLKSANNPVQASSQGYKVSTNVGAKVDLICPGTQIAQLKPKQRVRPLSIAPAMVYTGRPSRACATCKKRRIKCDEGRPACGQCIKSKRECTGYKTEADLVFRDETTATAKRAAKSRRGKSASSDDDDNDDDDADCSEIISHGCPAAIPLRLREDAHGFYASVPSGLLEEAGSEEKKITSTMSTVSGVARAPSPPVLDFAKAYFFCNFVKPRRHHGYSHFQQLEDFFRVAASGDTITKITEALSLLSLSKRPTQSHLQTQAREAYGRAVEAVAKAVSDPIRIRHDETLLGVQLLSFAETLDVTSASEYATHLDAHLSGEKGIRRFHLAWGAHARGAMSILSLRGLEDMTSRPSSTVLYIQTRFTAIIRGIRHFEAVDHIKELWNPAIKPGSFLESFRPQLDLATVGLRIPRLRERALKSVCEPMQPGLTATLNALLVDIRNVEIDLLNWAHKYHNECPEQIIGYYTPDNSETDIGNMKAYPGPVHNYESLLVMTVWNIYRTFRLYNQMLIFNILERLLPLEIQGTHPDILTCRDTLTRLAADVCASIPFALGYLDTLILSPASSDPQSSQPVSWGFTTPNRLPESFFPGVETFLRQEWAVPAVTLGSTHPEPDDTQFEALPIDPFNILHDFSDTANSASSSELVSGTAPEMPQSQLMSEEGMAMSAWYAIWPLHVAQCTLPVSIHLKDWIKGRFLEIVRLHGIEQALLYSKRKYCEYTPGKPRSMTPHDFAPPPFEPLQ